MNTPPKFSIITVCFNEAGSIRDTCESVCSQTFADFEWIVIDGGSTDGTLDILAEYKSQISCLISEQDSGIYHAMNKGVSFATGEYLVFMNGGDCFFDAEVLATVAEAQQKDVIFGDTVSLTYEGATKRRRFSGLGSPRLFLQKKRMMPHQASYIKRELFERHGGYNESYVIAGDYDLFVRFLSIGRASCVHIDKPLAVFAEGGLAGRPEMNALRRAENHRVRFEYFPRYRFSLKGLLYQMGYKILGCCRIKND